MADQALQNEISKHKSTAIETTQNATQKKNNPNKQTHRPTRASCKGNFQVTQKMGAEEKNAGTCSLQRTDKS